MAKIDYDWAVNKLKLEQAISSLELKKKLNPSLEINEETIREEYILRAGLIHEKTAVQGHDEDPAATGSDAGETNTGRGGRGRRSGKTEE